MNDECIRGFFVFEHQQKRQTMIDLKPCPFCGGKVKFLLLDDEFNVKNEEYAKDPWNGLQYGLYHSMTENEDCPIATGEEEMLGMYGYDTQAEAAEAWNRRCEK